jgi:hypothetical protein
MSNFLSTEADILGNEFSTTLHKFTGSYDIDFDWATSSAFQTSFQAHKPTGSNDINFDRAVSAFHTLFQAHNHNCLSLLPKLMGSLLIILVVVNHSSHLFMEKHLNPIHPCFFDPHLDPNYFRG